MPTRVVMLAHGSVEIHVRPIKPTRRAELAGLAEDIMRGRIDDPDSPIRAKLWRRDEFGKEQPGAEVLSPEPPLGLLSVRETRALGRALWSARAEASHWIIHYERGSYPKTAEKAAARSAKAAARRDTAIEYREPRDDSIFTPMASRLRATAHSWLGLNWGPRMIAE